MSNVMLYYLHRRASRLDVAKWPVGGSRLESIGNIVYGEIFTLFIVLISNEILGFL
jgi:hypothetical protein